MSEATTLPDFNPSKNPIVDEIKRRTEELLDFVKVSCPNNRQRSVALTEYEGAAMWAVKSLFVPPGTP